MDQLRQVVMEVFPDAGSLDFTDTLKLGQIPGWDSMSSVSFIIELQAALGVSLKNIVLTADHTVGELRRLIANATIQHKE